MEMKDNLLCKLARSNLWQSVYVQCKEIGIQPFENNSNFSRIQITFLQLLAMFNNLYLELSIGEDLISEEVIDCPIRRDAYLLYKKKERENQKMNKKSDNEMTDKIVFRPRKNKVNK